MYRFLSLVLLATLFCLAGHAQSKKDTLVYYVKNDGSLVQTKQDADYFMLILPETQGEKKNVRPVIGLYTNGKRKMIASAEIKSNSYSFEGTQMMFHPNGKRSSVTVYEKGRPIGEQITYYPNGTVYTRKDFQKNQTLLIECRDSTGVLWTENGNGKWMELDNTFTHVLATGEVKNGLMEGVWYQDFSKITYKKGHPDQNIIYLGGSKRQDRALLIGEKDYLSDDTSTIYKSKLDTLISIIYKKIDRSEVLNNTGKQLYVGFFVEENGSLNNFKVFQSSSTILNERLISIIKSTSPWKVSKKRMSLMLPLFFPGDSLTLDTAANLLNTKVDIKPDFPGGLAAFGKFLEKNITYPTIERDFNVMGKVFVGFVVEKDGSITDLHVERAPSIGLAEEAIRVVRLSPNWTPGSIKGRPVRVKYTLPINFMLGEEEVSYKPLLVDGLLVNSYANPDVSPEFPGGLTEFGKFLQSKLRYPEIDKRNKVTGKVFISFTVEPDGTLANIKPVRGPSQTLIEEALRVIKLSPPWKPALVKDKPVRVQYTVPINFGAY